MSGLSPILGVLIGLALPGELSDRPWDCASTVRPASASARHVLPVSLQWRKQLLRIIEATPPAPPMSAAKSVPARTPAFASHTPWPSSPTGTEICYLQMSLQR